MDLAANPYSPGSGLRPKVLSGRKAEVEAFDLLIARTKLRRPNRGMVLTGLREGSVPGQGPDPTTPPPRTRSSAR